MHLADVTGDGNGRADVAVNQTGVTVRRSNGIRFQPNEDWSHGGYYGSIGNSVDPADVTTYLTRFVAANGRLLESN